MTRFRFFHVFAVCLLVGCMCATSARSQSEFEYGFAAGVNSSTLSGDHSDEYSHRTGLRLGAYLAVASPIALSFAPEVWYGNKGATATYSGDKFTLKLECLEFDALGRFLVPVGPTTRLRLFAGPFLSIKLSMRETMLSEENTDAELEQNMSNTNSAFIGATLGAGIDFMLFRDLRMRCDVRYDFGFTSLPSTEDTDLSLYDRTLAFTVGVGI